MNRVLKNSAVQTLLTSMLCVLAGLLIGYFVLLMIEPSGAWDAILAILKNFFNYSRTNMQMKHLGTTLAKTAPLIMCSLSVIFSYRAGLFNIGVAGQYVVGACASLYAALVFGWSWMGCIVFAAVLAAIWGVITGLLKAYFHVNEVISGIMLNWIALYLANMILSGAKDPASAYTYTLKAKGKQALLPSVGMEQIFFNNRYVGIAIPLAVLLAIVVWAVIEKTKLGYELKATGMNKNAAQYCGMAAKRNIILSLAISGALAGIGASFLYLTDMEQWQVTMSSLPGMGFNGIAAAFLGGLSPIGSVFSAFLIQHISDGGSHVDLSVYSAQISDLIAGIIIYLCGFVAFAKLSLNRRLEKMENRKGGMQS